MIGVGKAFTGLFIASLALVVAYALGSPNYDAKGTFHTQNIVVEDNVNITPVQWSGGGGNLPTGQIDDFTLPAMATNSLIVIRCADNEGTRISGIDATGIHPGDIRWFINLPTGASPPVDAGSCVFLHENTGSLPADRIQTPSAADCKQSIYSILGFMYGGLDAAGNNRWHIVGGNCGRTSITTTSSLALYPICVTPTIVGSQDEFRPTCQNGLTPGFGLDGITTDSNAYTLILVNTDAGGASLTGLYTAADVSNTTSLGPVRILTNLGPGPLTLKNLAGGSTVQMRFQCPQGKDLTIAMNESVMLVSPLNKGTDLVAQWYVIALGASNEYFPSVNTTGRLTFAAERMTPALSPGALANIPTVTHNFDPGVNVVVRVTTGANGSIIDGLVAHGTLPFDGDTRVIKNLGPGPLIILPEIVSTSAVDNRFTIVGGIPFTVPVLGTATVQYDNSGKWVILDRANALGNLTLPLSVTPAVLPVGNTDDWDPVDASTGLSWQYVYQIRSQGSVGTILRTMNPPLADGQRFVLANYSSGYTIKNAAAAGATGRPFVCPGGVDFVLLTNATVEIYYDQAAASWRVLASRQGGA